MQPRSFPISLVETESQQSVLNQITKCALLSLLNVNRKWLVLTADGAVFHVLDVLLEATAPFLQLSRFHGGGTSTHRFPYLMRNRKSALIT